MNPCFGNDGNAARVRGDGFKDGVEVVVKVLEGPPGSLGQSFSAPIKGGNFEIPFLSDGCLTGPVKLAYRIDTQGDGRCDEQDHVYVVDISTMLNVGATPIWTIHASGGPEPGTYSTGPGAPSDCSLFGPGWDLSFPVSAQASDCDRGQHVELLDDHGEVIREFSKNIRRHKCFAPPARFLFPGALEEGKSYRLRFFDLVGWGCDQAHAMVLGEMVLQGSGPRVISEQEVAALPVDLSLCQGAPAPPPWGASP